MATPLDETLAAVRTAVEALTPPDHPTRTYHMRRRERFGDESAHRTFWFGLPTDRRCVGQNDTGELVQYMVDLVLQFDGDGLLDFTVAGFLTEASTISYTIDTGLAPVTGLHSVITQPHENEYDGEDGEATGRVRVTIPLQITVGETP